MEADDVDQLDPDEIGAALTKAMPALAQLLEDRDFDDENESASE